MKANEKLNAILRQTGWTQVELAGNFGVTPKSVSFWLSGKKSPSTVNLKKIDELYHREVFIPLENKAKALEAKLRADEHERANTASEDQYFRSKLLVMDLERKNNSHIYLFLSQGEQHDEWYKIGGRSLLFYKNYLAPRLGREVKIRDDNDKDHRFRHGIGSVRWGNRLISGAEELNLKAYKIEYGIIVVELGKKYTPSEIREMEEKAKAEREAVRTMTRPALNFPELEVAISKLAQYLPSKIRKMDQVYRQVFGPELYSPLIVLQKTYIKLANGRIEQSVAKEKMLEAVDDFIAIIRLIDEGGLLELTARTRLGENIIAIKE